MQRFPLFIFIHAVVVLEIVESYSIRGFIIAEHKH